MTSFTQTLAWGISDVAVLTKRNLLRYKRIPQLLVFSTIQPIMFLLLFTFVFGGSIQGVGENYINYLLPGILMQSALFGSLQTGVGLADDMTKGIVDRLRTLPMTQLALLAGRTVSDAIRNVFVVTVMLLVGMLIGFDPVGGFAGIVLAALMTVGFGFAFSWISATIGLAVRNPETAQVAGFVWVFPLIYISSAYVPVASLPKVLKFIATYSPITVTIDSVRALTNGTATLGGVFSAVTWMMVIVAIFVPVAVRLYRKTA